LKDGKLDKLKANRYKSFDSGEGKAFEEGQLSLEQLVEIGRNADTKDISGKQEMLYNMVNQYLFNR
jgi:xylose isomerase